jgi:Cu/Ag efflux protein CusF
VFAARAGDDMILVRHEAVPGLMDDMQSMLFFAESKAMLDAAALTPGDRVRFTVRKAPDKLLVVEIRKIQ